MPQAPCSKLPVLFRCDGSPEIGLGHIVRCLALADELRDAHGYPIAFAMRKGPLGIKMVEEKGYRVIALQESGQYFDYGNWLIECVKEVAARVIVLDVRDGLTREAVKELRNKGILIVTIDDSDDKRLEADLAFYPPVPQVQSTDWAGFTGQLYAGWEWVVLRREFAYRPPRIPHNHPVILVTMGGSDPAGLTLKTVEALDPLDEDFETVVVLGPSFCHGHALNNLLLRARRRFNLRQDVTDMPGLMAQADLAVVSFGVTAYELLAMSVPAIHVCLTADHSESASAFVEAGVALNLGVYGDSTPGALARSVRSLLEQNELRILMSRRASGLIDGGGAARIADLIATNVERGHVTRNSKVSNPPA